MTHRILGKTPEGRALFRLIVEMTHAIHRLRAEGAKFGAVTPSGVAGFSVTFLNWYEPYLPVSQSRRVLTISWRAELPIHWR